MASNSPFSSSIRRRRRCSGSCHCGKTEYVAFLTFPPEPVVSGSDGFPPESMLIYKCNCRLCHKMGMFHVRLKSSPDDFFLITPTDLEDGVLQDYTCDAEMVHWYFCKTCGVRCFAFRGVGETVEVNVNMVQGRRTEEGLLGKTVKVWRPKKDQWDEVTRLDRDGSYLSVNAQTLEPKDGVDLREWTEKHWVWYKADKTLRAMPRLLKPHEGGCY